MVKEPNFTSIRISRSNYEELRKKGHTPETFDSIISKVLAENKLMALTTDGAETEL